MLVTSVLRRQHSTAPGTESAAILVTRVKWSQQLVGKEMDTDMLWACGKRGTVMQRKWGKCCTNKECADDFFRQSMVKRDKVAIWSFLIGKLIKG
jgi:hypothetical protein